MPQLSGISSLAVSLPQGGGDVRGLGGSFIADYNRGTGSYTLDLRLPAGPAGLRPALALGYNSGGANGAFGLGWSLGVPSVHRDGERQFVQYDDNDGFRLDLYGELIKLADGRYRPKYDELFAQLERGDHWTLKLKDGGVQRYGIDAGARVVHPDHPDRVLAWALQEAEDRNGNLIRYRYLADRNNKYLAEAAYGPYRVVLTYEARPDVFGTSRHGFLIETALRCAGIEIHCDRLAGATLIRRYTLSYTEPEETPISLLHQVRISGHRGNEVETMPALTFGYTSYEASGSRCRALKGELNSPLAPLGRPGTDLLDCTGDGLPDIIQIDGEQHRYWANRGDGLFDAPRQIRSLPSGVRLGAPGTSFGDIDGDGAVDLLVAEGASTGFFPKIGPATWGRFQRYPRAPTYSLRDVNNRLVDLDADGRVDLLRSTPAGFVLHLNRGANGWEALPPIARIRDIDAFPDVSLSDPRVHLADMTGDGLADIVLVKSGEISYWPYEGLGRWGRRRVLAGAPAFARPTQPRSIFLSDVNGDGVADLVIVEADVVRVWINRFGVALSKPYQLQHAPLPGGAELRLADMLGSGTSGVLWSYRENLRPHTSYFYLDLAGEQKPYLLSSIDNGFGKTTRIRYRSSSQFSSLDRKDGRAWQTFLPFPVQVVAEIQQQDQGSGAATHLEIRYHDGLYDGRERRFAGFGRVDLIEHGDATAPALLTRMRFDATPTPELGGDDRVLAVARWGKMLETRQQTLDGQILRTSISTWTAATADRGVDGTPIVTVHRTATRNEAPGQDGTTVINEHTYAFDELGNVTSDRSTANGDAPLTLTSEVEYARRPDGSLTALPSRVVEKGTGGEVIREFRCYYDGAVFVGLPLGQATKGNVTRHSIRVLHEADFTAHYGTSGFTAAVLGFRTEAGAVWTDSGRFNYDARGNLIASRDPLGRESTIMFDNDGLFPIRLENAAGHVTTFQWDDAASQPMRIEDPNGAESRFAFDALGRVVRLALPGDSLADPTETVAFHLHESPPFAELTQKRGTNASRARRRMYYDGNGEVRQTRATVDDSVVVVSGFESRNARGWLGRRGDPTFASSLDFSPAPEASISTLHYDAIGRVIATDLPGGRRTRVVFDAFHTVSYDANDTDDSPANLARGFFDTPTTHRLDGWGRVVEVSEQHDGTVTKHTFQYDEAGRLIEARGPDGGRIVQQQFDLAGNRIALDHRDAGRRRFFYDAAAQLVCTIDAKGARVETTYDVLGRPIATSIDGVVAHRFVYDAMALPNRIGRLSSIQDEAGDWEFEYDARGRTTRRKLTAFGESWHLEHRYHPNGQVSGIQYPDGAEIEYQYNHVGQLVEIPGALDSVTFDARGRRTSLRATNGVTTSIDYSPSTCFLERVRVVGTGGATLHDTSYHRDNVGNVLAQTDGRPPGADAPHSRTFVLDGRYRLVTTAGGGSAAIPAYVRTYKYDAASNVRQFPTHGDAPIEYDPQSNRIAGITVNGALVPLYSHDANGNVVRLPERDLAFDTHGRLLRVRRDDGAEVAYRYNAAGERIWRTTTIGGVTRRTLFLAGVYEEDDDGAVRRYVAASGMPIAVDESGARSYLHCNELGHVVATTDTAGALANSRFFHPFGETAATTSTVLPTFGGKILDDVSGLYHFGARDYAPEIGRFVSPDPLYLDKPLLAISNPQLFNLYAYAANNPLIYSDPSGYSLMGSVLGGLIGGLVGAIVFVVTAGNPLLAGLAGGLVGGAVAGGIDGGVKGAVVGGLFGALSGGFGGLAVWGMSAASVAIGGRLMQEIVMTSVATLGVVTTAIGGAVQGGINGNWDLLASAGAGIVGSLFGTLIANRVMMTGFWTSGENPRQVRDAHRMFAERARSTADISGTKYHLERQKIGGACAFEQHGVVTFVDKPDYSRIGGDYLEYLHTHAHELGHAIQEKTYSGPFADFDAAWADSLDRKKYSWGSSADNPFQLDADNKGRWLMNYSPYPYQAYANCIGPALLAASIPTSYDNRKDGGDFWRDFDSGER